MQIEKSTEFADYGQKTAKCAIEHPDRILYKPHHKPKGLKYLKWGMVSPTIDTPFSTIYGYFGPCTYGGILV